MSPLGFDARKNVWEVEFFCQSLEECRCRGECRVDAPLFTVWNFSIIYRVGPTSLPLMDMVSTWRSGGVGIEMCCTWLLFEDTIPLHGWKGKSSSNWDMSASCNGLPKTKIKENAKTDSECSATVLRWKSSHESRFVGGMMVVWRAGVYNVEYVQIITIPCSSRACHAEGRQIERTNGSQGDAVWSNLVQEEVWWLRERHGEK